MLDNCLHFSYHVLGGRLVKMNDNQLMLALNDRVKSMIKKKLGLKDIQNKVNLFGITDETSIHLLNFEELVSLAFDLGITEHELENDNTLFHVIGFDNSNHTFCIHDFETNTKQVFIDFANIIVTLFDIEPNFVAPVILSNIHDSYLNEGIIFVMNDPKCGPIAQAIEKINPLYQEIVLSYSSQ